MYSITTRLDEVRCKVNDFINNRLPTKEYTKEEVNSAIGGCEYLMSEGNEEDYNNYSSIRFKLLWIRSEADTR